MLFFFSSRRRHTRLQGDWSSDVCSSDLRIAERGLRAAPCVAYAGDARAQHRRGDGERAPARCRRGAATSRRLENSGKPAIVVPAKAGTYVFKEKLAPRLRGGD